MTDVNIIIGRFMPLHLGHISILQKMYNENSFPTIICNIHNTKFDEKHPFSDELITKEMDKCLKGEDYYQGHIFVKSAAIDIIGKELHDQGYTPHLWGCGTDRAKAFEKMANNPKYRKNGELPDDFKVFVVDRDEHSADVAGISATKVREALKNDDKAAFVKMMPDGAQSLYDDFKKAYDKVMEKNESLSSLSDYMTNDNFYDFE